MLLKVEPSAKVQSLCGGTQFLFIFSIYSGFGTNHTFYCETLITFPVIRNPFNAFSREIIKLGGLRRKFFASKRVDS